MITFKNDDEKHAWDLYSAALIKLGTSIEDSTTLADVALKFRREREPKTEPTGAATLERAIEAAGFRFRGDLLGAPTLWCVECSRDSGYHYNACSKRGDP
jgi:hypothetical protein